MTAVTVIPSIPSSASASLTSSSLNGLMMASNPTGSDETFSVSVTKFTPDTFGGTVPLIWNAGILSAGDDRITVPESVTVPANGSTTLTVTVNAGLGTTAQGWINLDGPGSNDLHFAYLAIVGR
jgi:hypothetical protein